MILRTIATGVIALLMTGCANSPNRSAVDPRVAEVMSYISINRPLAENGSMKWSAYYAGLYERQSAANTAPELLQILNKLLWNAQQYEKGAIPKDEFEYTQRDLRSQAVAANQRRVDAANAEQRARTLLAIQMMQANQYRPVTMPPLNTTSPVAQQQYSMPLLGSAQATVTAFWTGKQVQAQTVTNQFGWNCEYNYAGKTFWRTFVGSCPSSVQVQ